MKVKRLRVNLQSHRANYVYASDIRVGRTNQHKQWLKPRERNYTSVTSLMSLPRTSLCITSSEWDKPGVSSRLCGRYVLQVVLCINDT